MLYGTVLQIMLASAMQEPGFEICLTKQLESLRAISSIQFSATHTSLERNRNQPEQQDFRTLTYYFQNGMARLETDRVNQDSGIRSILTVAFNNDRFQYLDNGRLVLSDEPPFPTHMGNLNPLTLPYGFVFESEYSFNILRNNGTWQNDRFSKVEFAGSDSVNNLKCDVFSGPGSNAMPGTTFTVYFAKELNCFPIKSELHFNGQLLGSSTVVEYSVQRFDGLEIVIPIVVEVKSTVDDYQIVDKFEIDQNSLKINQSIDEDIFTIPTSLAEYVVDSDAGTSVRIGGVSAQQRAAEESAEASAQWWRWVGGIGFVLVIGAALAFLFYKRQK